jgi:thiol-disulfide isomerase/thioredoxin
MKRKAFVGIWMLLLATTSMAQKSAYELDFSIEGCPSGTAILAYYYGNKQYIKDSTKIDDKGHFVFKGDKPLDQGIYIAVMPPDNKYFELIVDEDQQFKMATKHASPIEAMKVTGSDENIRFYDYLRFLNKQKKKSTPFTDKLAEMQKADSVGYKDKPEFKELQQQMDAIDEEVKDFKNKYIEDYPNSLLTKVFRASKDPDIPEPPLLENGKPDSTFQWRWFKDHYWDLVDFSDDRIIRTPVFHSRLERFMTKTVMQVPDSVIKEASKLVEKTRKSKELFKYTVFWITSHFETSKQMGMESVFVHMAKSYYMTGQAFWADTATVAKIGDRATKLSYSLIGNTAPNLIMKDTSGVFQILHAIPAEYTIAYFWDPDCGHCKKVTPKVKEFYDQFKKELNIEVYAVTTNTEREDWIKYIKENNLDWINVEDPEQKTAYKYLYDIYSTPVIYLLDKDKKIIAKRLGAEDLEGFIRHHKKKSS